MQHVGMLTELIKEVNRLEQELSETREKLKRTEDKLKTVTLGGKLETNCHQYFTNCTPRRKLERTISTEFVISGENGC